MGMDRQDPVLEGGRSGRPEDIGKGLTRISRRGALLLLATVIAVGTLVGVSAAVYLLNRPTGVPRKEVVIQKGMTVAQIARLLHREGIIRSPSLLRILSLVGGTSRRLTAGVHPFYGWMSTRDVLMELKVPRDITRDVTIPEGLWVKQMVRLLAEALELDGDTLTRLASDPAFCRALGVEADNLEGYLFPETYRFSLMMDEEQALRTMVEHFFTVFDRAMRARAREMDMSVHQVVTLASIIEGEAQQDSERALISAVYHNRLRRRMRLQADPTVQYAIADGPRRLFYRDYKVDSPYNTYRHSGLPPGPVMSPGEASLRAALYPAEVDYLYFVAQGDGSHTFSRTMREHDEAKRKTRWARRRTWVRSRRD